MVRKKTFSFSAIILLFPILLFSQEKTIDKANTAYKQKEYAEAAKLYEVVIAEKEASEKKSGLTNLKTKLANCYRMNNKMEKAEAIYQEVVKEERVDADIYLFYGETLMSNGKYDSAKEWFLEYQRAKPEDEQGALMAANCDKVKLIQPYFPSIKLDTFEHNSGADDNSPVAWQEGLVFSSDRKQGAKLMKEKSGWTGRDYLDLYFSALGEDSTFAAPKRFSAKLSEVNKNTGNASFSADGKEVYFTRNDNVLDKSGTYNLQLFRAKNNGNGKWKKVEKLSFCSSNILYMHPAISPDGSELFFTTNRKGEGGTDIWVSKWQGDDWGKPENLGPTINTKANEGFPFMDSNGRLYFCSKGHPTYGGFDIFFSERDEYGRWQTPVNLGKPINSSLDDISIYIYPNGKEGLFTSSRSGGDDDIYIFKITDRPIGDEQWFVESGQASIKTEKVNLNISPDAKGELIGEMDNSIRRDTTAATTTADSTSANNDMATAMTKEEKTKVEGEEKPEVFEEIEKDEPVVLIPAENTIKEAPTKETQDKAHLYLDTESATELDEPEKTQEFEIDEDITLKTVAEDNSNNEKITGDALVKEQNSQENIKVETTSGLLSFQQLIDKANNNELHTDETYRIDGATFDENVWQLTPKIAKKLNELVTVLRKYPEMKIEISAHTESLGLDEKNLELSRNRASMAVEYMLREGIAKERIKSEGYGEMMPLNHCKDGVTCSMEEHLFNQRFEVKIKL